MPRFSFGTTPSQEEEDDDTDLSFSNADASPVLNPKPIEEDREEEDGEEDDEEEALQQNWRVFRDRWGWVVVHLTATGVRPQCESSTAYRDGNASLRRAFKTIWPQNL
ncbi:hypothetical protein Tco_1317131 [Tanacetum coccineum]